MQTEQLQTDPLIDTANRQWNEASQRYRETEQRVQRFRQFLQNNRGRLQELQNDDPANFRTLCDALKRHEQQLNTNQLFKLFPDEQYKVYNPKFDEWLDLRRENYRKHIAFINATKDNQFMAFFAGNRVGKTQVGAYMTACHLTGMYPPWWKGHRFKGPIQAWAVVQNYESTKDPVQKMLFGRFFPGQQKTVTGDGMVPKSLIDIKSLQGRGGAAPDVLASVAVRHINSSGRQNFSQLHFKSFEQSEQSFVGRAVDWIWIDEGPSYQIFKQCSMRIVSEKGRLILTWTPLNGYTPVVQEFIPRSTSLGKVFDSDVDVVKVTERAGLVMAGWKDIPHIPQREKTGLIQHFRDTGQSEQMIDARIKGIPHVGAGKIYTMPREQLYFDRAKMGRFPPHWKHAYGMDHGWRVTAAVWGCLDPDNGILYIYNEHYGQQRDVIYNAAAIKARGEWKPGVIDPAALQSQQSDGKRMIDEYRKQGLILTKADHAVQAGIQAVKNMMFGGKLKVAKDLQWFWKEYDLYRRELDDEQDVAKIWRKDNHVMDAMRYLIVSGLSVACSQSETKKRRDMGSFKLFKPGDF